MDGALLGELMSGWRRLLEEESEHQWLSFAVFSAIVIIGAVLIDWSSDLSGVHDGSTLEVDGIVMDSAGDSILYQTDEGIRVTYNDNENNAQYATCLEEYRGMTLACLGNEGMLGFIGDGSDDCDDTWCQFSIGENITATQVSGNGLAILMVVQDGTSDALAAIWFGESNPEPMISDHEGNMHLDVILPTEDGWMVGGSWQAPANWLGSNPTSPPMYELILHVTWDGVNAPAIEIVHMGNEGAIHGLFATDEGVIATGTSDTVSIINDEITSLGMSSYAAVGDNNGDVWLFGGIGSDTVAIITGTEISVERLPEPLKILPSYVTCDEDGMISIHGTDNSDSPSSLSIDSNARQSFTSLRGILDLSFMLVSILIFSIMGWNIFEAIRKGEVF
ncbi:MAG: hypothetical protein CMA90_00225 [Euryarchaeota archaeon]|nr:hypothetical protein [Euryarchaeota archaeon]